MMNLNIAAHSGIGQVRRQNEDHYLVQSTIENRKPTAFQTAHDDERIASHGLLCAVADGMGGHRGGERASRIALEVLAREYFRSVIPHEDSALGERLRQCVIAADGEVRAAGQSDPSCYGMGTTLVGLAIHGNLACGFNAGDSRLYRLRSGFLKQLSSDHSLVAELERSGQISREQAENFHRKQVLTNCVGGFPDMEMYVDIYLSISLLPGDRFLLCSDGVSNAFDAKELESLCRLERDPDDCARKLVEESDRRGGLDNATVVIIDLVGSAVT